MGSTPSEGIAKRVNGGPSFQQKLARQRQSGNLDKGGQNGPEVGIEEVIIDLLRSLFGAAVPDTVL